MDLFHGIHMDLSMESMVDMPTFHMESSGIHVELCWIPGGFHMDYTGEGKDLSSYKVLSWLELM